MHPSPSRPRLRSLLASLAVVAALGAAPGYASAAPTGDLTKDAALVDKAYRGLLIRRPTPTEVAAGVASIASEGRSGFLDALVQSPEFRVKWTLGVYLTYLEQFPSATESAAATAALAATGDFLATEVTVLTSADYRALAGEGSTAYVTALFDDVLFRSPDPEGLAYWVDRLDAGSTPSTLTRSLLRSAEAARKRVGGTGAGLPCATTHVDDDGAVRAGSYCIVLRRPADQGGIDYWSPRLASTGQLPDLWVSLAASAEYYAAL